MISRRVIINGKQYVHVISRCHDRNFFMEPRAVKRRILFLFAKYARNYGIKVYEFIIMDNHYHFLLEAPDAESLSNFMRTVNSQTSSFINKHFVRDSQALRERFKSPVINGKKYFLAVMQYIWLNRKEADSTNNPKTDEFNSISWRLNKKAPQLFEDPEDQFLIDHLLTDYKHCTLDLHHDAPNFFLSLLNDGLKQMKNVMDKFLENFHTIGDAVFFGYRQEVINAHRRLPAPPGVTSMPNKSSPLTTE